MVTYICYNTYVNLFDFQRETQLEQEAPLAARMRPCSFTEFVVQEDKEEKAIGITVPDFSRRSRGKGETLS